MATAAVMADNVTVIRVGAEEEEEQYDAIYDDVIQRAIQEDPELNDIINKLDSNVSLDADHHLHMGDDDDDDNDDDDDYEGTSSAYADSDSLSTSSSFKENEGDQIQNGVLTTSSTNNTNSSTTSHNNNNNNNNNTFRTTPDIDQLKNGVVSSSSNIAFASSSSSSSSASPSSLPSSTSPKLSSPTSSNGHPHPHPGPSPSPSKESLASRDSGSATTSDGEKKKKSRGGSIRNSLRALKKLTKFADKDEPKKREKRRSFSSEFTAVVVDRLPQIFVVKYLGYRDVQGMFGLHHVRRPVDEMVRQVKKNIETQPDTELPLLYVVVSPKGLDLREHKRNKVKKGFPPGLMPIDFISYGVQDIKYWRVFTCIVVRELSSRTRLASCHAFLCDSSHSGRKMALALGAAFSVYSKKLKSDGKTHNFQVELRPPDELADAIDAEFDA